MSALANARSLPLVSFLFAWVDWYADYLDAEDGGNMFLQNVRNTGSFTLY
jgi:hypothetical protein